MQIFGPLADFPSAKAPGDATRIAVASDGRIALIAAGDKYRIRAYERDGSWKEIVPDIARTRYSDAERDAQDRSLARRARLLAAESTRRGADPGASPPLPTEKPRLLWRGLRFDPIGRLWVLTGRRNERETVLDLFDARLNFVGEVMVGAPLGA